MMEFENAVKVPLTELDKNVLIAIRDRLNRITSPFKSKMVDVVAEETKDTIFENCGVQLICNHFIAIAIENALNIGYTKEMFLYVAEDLFEDIKKNRKKSEN